MSDIKTMLQSGKILILDGAMGTMLQSSGLPDGTCPERFCLDNPHTLKEIHQAYVDAGADILTTCTFGGNEFKLPPEIDVLHFNKTMAEIAVSASASAGRKVFVAGNVGPTGHFVRPLGQLEPSRLISSFRQQIRGLIQGGIDCILIETQFDLAEARAAVIAAKLECTLPIIVSMTFEQGVSLTGSSPEVFVETMQNLGVLAIGTNCSAGPEQMLSIVEQMLKYSDLPIMVEPNAGLPELINGKTVFRLNPENFAEKTAIFAVNGAQILGGCCGTTPKHIRALKDAVCNIESKRCKLASASGTIAITSRSNIVKIGQGQALTLIGELINPTGKKKLTEEFQVGQLGLALKYAEEQIQLGVGLIDVNVGAPLVDESILLPELAIRLIERINIPLSLDSSNMDAIANALPYCPGSALVNSISGEDGRMEILGALCRDYGSPFILLPLRGKKLPVKASERIAIIEDLLAKADAMGIPRRLIMVDVLALAVSSKAEAGAECLETIRWCRQEKLATTIGLSNVSFGLPARGLLNATYLALALGAGLSSCIANPRDVRLREVFAASNVLLGRDKNAQSFIANYAKWSSDTNNSIQNNIADSVEIKSVEEAVIKGAKEDILALVEKELENGVNPFDLVQEKLIPAITKVGDLYEKKEYFLPQLIRSAETMQEAFKRLKPLLEAQKGKEKEIVIVLATVEGDIHDIGKNIVALLMGNHGFRVIDAGKDVKAEDIVALALKHNAQIIGLSALMTTTMVRMEDTIKIIKEKKLPMRVIIGGAVVTQAFADAIGADAYSPDAVNAVRTAKKLLLQ